jgi:hypothetical protein
MRYELLTAVRVSMLVFWVVTQYGLSGRQTLRRNIQHPALKMEAVYSYETLALTYNFT